MKRSEAIRLLREQRQELVGRFGIASLSLFGSVARDEARANSDVDLLVEFKQPVGLFTFIELQQYLETLLGCKVDLGSMRSLKPYLRAQVLQEVVRVT
jgi:predicted nucleotidyltransferase